MHVPMPPDAFPPDEARGGGGSAPDPADANVVDPVVLAERRALRAEQAEQVAAKRAADAQALAADLARERARLEAELERVQVRLAPAEDAEEVAGIRRSLASAEEELASLRRRVAEAEQAAREAIAARERAEEERDAAGAARSRAAAELEAVQAELEGLRAARDAARAEVVTAWKNTEAAHTEIDRAMRERDAARAEAAAAREGADAVVTEAAHVLSQRDAIEAEVVAVRSERDALRDELAAVAAAREAAAAAPANPATARTAPPSSWAERIEAELSLARRARAVADTAPARPTPSVVSPALARERRLVARHAAEPTTFTDASDQQMSTAPAFPPAGEPSLSAEAAARATPADQAAPLAPPAPAGQSAPVAPPTPADRATSVDPARLVLARTLERERAVRLQAQLDRAQAAERELREQIAALQEAVQGRVDAERRIETALRRARTELEQANAAAAAGPAPDPRIDALEAQIAALMHRLDAPAPVANVGPASASPAPETPTESAFFAEPAEAAEPVSRSAPASAGKPATEAIAGPVVVEQPARTPADAPAAEAAAESAAVAQPALAPADPAAPDAAAAGATADPHSPATPPLPTVPPALIAEPAPAAGAGRPIALDVLRLDAARTRLRVSAATDDAVDTAPETDTAPEPGTAAATTATGPAARRPWVPSGPPAPWLPAALIRLHRDDPRAVGRILAGMVKAQGLVTQRAIAYDLELTDRGILAVTVDERGTSVRQAGALRPRNQVDFRVSTDETGLARLLVGRRRPFRRRAHVRGSRRRLKELRRLARSPLGLRDLATSGVELDPSLAFRLAALAIDPADTWAHRFTIAHAPLAGGPADAWLRIQPGGPVAVVRARPGEEPAVTLRCTRGALLAVLADVEPPAGEGAAIDGDAAVLDLVRGWIRRTEHPRNRVR